MIDRRGFLGSSVLALAGTALAAGKKTERWRGWKPGEFQIHMIHTGVAESQFLVFPDGTSMLVDCGDHPALTRLELSVPVKPNPGRLAGDWIARYVRRVNPRGDCVDYLEPSHWHADHTGSPGWTSLAPSKVKTGLVRSGFGLAAEQLHFSRAVDRGWPDYDDPLPPGHGESPGVIDHMRAVYGFLAKRDGLTVERFRLGAKDQIVCRHGAAADFSVFNLCGNGRVALRDGSVRDFYADLRRDGWKSDRLNENALSLGHVFSYGRFRYFTAGDASEWYCFRSGVRRELEEDLADALEPVSVAKVCHHGHHCMPAKLVAALRPQVWLASVWDQLHMTPDTLRRLSDRAAYGGRKDVLVCPGVFPRERMDRESSEPYFRDLAPECLGGGCHAVVTVAPGGALFDVDFLSAEDESLRVVGHRSFEVEDRLK